MNTSPISFKGQRFPQEIILHAVYLKLRFSLSYRDIEELLSMRNLLIDHSSIQRWVDKYSPLLSEQMKKRKKFVGDSWYWDETYIKVNGVWMYLHRAVDKEGNTIDFYLSKNRDKKAALTFLRKAMGGNATPLKISIDKSGANISALDHLNEEYTLEGKPPIEKRCSKYLNNRIEQDHRFIKKRVKPMLGFKSFDSAEHTISGIETIRMIQKNQLSDRKGMSNFEAFKSLAA
ncbi:IS6 family transposase (plasmid) [Flammeovirga pectinis]|uniref:IS6 family transposase n=1 Tax=Flammeovirga pectinis TaxID=2494373 RepID=A0A3Q9FTB2_9BACT|nr:IS6 family transposase [Flammeovirga pectinis]AZQ65616.1 IS6 family transposase [Flammeovirga pectinis]